MIPRRLALLSLAFLLLVSLAGCDQGGNTNESPVAEFTSSVDRLTVDLNNESRDPDGTIASVQWEFGDGTTSAEASPTHTYEEANEYTIQLTVTDDGGATASTSRTISLEPSLGVFVANQGNFGDGNGSVSYYDRESTEATPGAVTGLESIVQGISINNGRLFVAANSATRVDLFTAGEYSQIGQVTEFSGPRYFAHADDETTFVTDQSFDESSTVQVLDLSGDSPQVTGRIEVPGTPEGLTTAGSRVYASLGAFQDTSLVAAIDVENRALTETIDVDCASRFVSTDSEGEVYAVCGNAPRVVRIDGKSGGRLGTVALPDTAATAFNVGQTASYAPAANELYVVANEDRVFRIDTQQERVDDTLGPFDGSPIGGVAYDPERQELYLARVSGFGSNGRVTIHERNGTQINTFPAGIAPTYIEFRRTGE